MPNKVKIYIACLVYSQTAIFAFVYVSYCLMMLDFWVWQWMSKYDTRGVWLDVGMEWEISVRYPQGQV
ncbi:hypothetical protein DXB01_07950 [Clostridium sp. OF10-22XD]|nr:hypothetical protein DXB01_07950 [Clostridium sp. OF10-22XD]